MEDIRRPAVAGYFYEADASQLRRRIEWCFRHRIGPGLLPERSGEGERESIGYVVPHAGYVYSGPVAAHAYYALSREKRPETIILIGPNHTGAGPPVSLAPWRKWRTPLGIMEVDVELRDYLVKRGGVIVPDYEAHLFEHSLEVQLPFIQYVYGEEVKILPIVALEQTPSVAEAVVAELEEAVEALGRDAVILASTDFNHYDPHDVTFRKDMRAIEAMESLDVEEFYRVVMREDVSVCGPLGVMVLMLLARRRRGGRPEILAHATSGDTSGDLSHTVGYVAAKFPLRASGAI